MKKHRANLTPVAAGLGVRDFQLQKIACLMVHRTKRLTKPQHSILGRLLQKNALPGVDTEPSRTSVFCLFETPPGAWPPTEILPHTSYTTALIVEAVHLTPLVSTGLQRDE